MTGTTNGDHLNTRVFLVAFELCICDGCNQVSCNSVDNTEGGHHIICIFRNSHTDFIFTYNSESLLFKSSFSFLVPLIKVLTATRSCYKSVLQAPLYKLMAILESTWTLVNAVNTSISKSMLVFRISSLTCPFCTQELLSDDRMKVFACSSAKQLFWSSTLFLKPALLLFLVDKSIAKLFVSRWRFVYQYCTSLYTGPSSAPPSIWVH